MIHLHQIHLANGITILIKSAGMAAATVVALLIFPVTLDPRLGLAITVAIPCMSSAPRSIMVINLSMSFLLLVSAQYKRFIRAVNHTSRYLPPRTKVALDNSFALQVSGKCSIRASYHARPAATALFHINRHLVTCRLFAHRACKTGINTPGLSAVAALNRERNLHVPLHTHTGQSTRSLLLKCFDGILRFRVLYLAVNFTESTTDADLFFNIYSFHVPKPS
jgi:hypothetical protein